MENPTTMSVAKFTSYTRVCQKFIEACTDCDVEPIEALQAIARFLNVPIGTTGSGVSLTSTNVVTKADPNKVQLSKPQVEEAKKQARAEKAKRLGLTLSEVNLTSAEAKEAKARMREKVAGVSQPPFHPGNSQKGKGGAKPQTTTAASQKVSGPDSKEEVEDNSLPLAQDLGTPIGQRNQAPQSGARSTAKTRIDNFRRNCLRQNPATIVDPTFLHLIAYRNHYSRLARQWAEFKQIYGSAGVLNPLRDLPNPLSLPKTEKSLLGILSRLREQSDSPGTYILQADNGASYWDRDMPGKACPDFLSELLPPEVVAEFLDASGAVN